MSQEVTEREQLVHAAGVALWRHTEQGQEFAVVHRPHRADWSLPKGKLDRGETLPEAAVREAEEETGLACALGADLGELRYPLPDSPRTKVVRYYTARYLGGTFAANAEVDELRWCTLEQARELLSYQHDIGILERASEIGTETSTLLLVRHAKAGDRADWTGADAARPLSDAGSRQASALRGFLNLWRPQSVHAAPRVRCVDTVAPLAADLGAEIAEEPLLTEEGYWPAHDAGLRRILEIAAETEVSAVSSQGGVIPDVVERLTELGPVPRPDRIRSKKGSVWVLTFRRTESRIGELISADYYPSALPKP